ncbi:MAG: RHS repeat-associated core domain-containing protein [Planctomycetales bacterium]|nr:RHS repeat-associated core domain-containing protein [Planctomycetales bacterium]
MVATRYIWNELTDNVVVEKDDQGNVTQYTQKPELYGKVLSQNRNGTRSYYHYDGQGSVRQLTDSSGTVTDTATYAAFGDVVAKTGTTVNPWGYKGALGYYAGESPADDLYVRARHLSPALGRWLAMDPIGYWDGLNRLIYVGNSPIKNVDPSGLVCEQDGKCCCCPGAIKVTDILPTYLDKYPKLPDTPPAMKYVLVGNDFTLSSTLTLVRAPTLTKDKPCKLEWYECTDRPYNIGTKWQPNTWKELHTA